MQSNYKAIIDNKTPIPDGTAVIHIMYRGDRVLKKEITSVDNREKLIESIITELSFDGNLSPVNPYPISTEETKLLVKELRDGLLKCGIAAVADLPTIIGDSPSRINETSVFVKNTNLAAGSPLSATTPNRMMKYFEYAHLPAHLQEVSKVLCEAAKHMDQTLPESAEKTVGLRKLLEAKDCFVRAALDNK